MVLVVEPHPRLDIGYIMDDNSTPGIPDTSPEPINAGIHIKLPKKRKPISRALKPLMRRTKFTMRDALLESESELSEHMQVLMKDILEDRRCFRYKPREKLAALELMAKILGRMAPTENVIMPIPPEQLKVRLEEIYRKIRGVQAGTPSTLFLDEPGANKAVPSLSSLSTDQPFEDTEELGDTPLSDMNGGGDHG